MSHTTNLGGSLCNSQEETGTHITLHAVAAVNSGIENIQVVMPCPDADILVLSIHQQIIFFFQTGREGKLTTVYIHIHCISEHLSQEQNNII